MTGSTTRARAHARGITRVHEAQLGELVREGKVKDVRVDEHDPAILTFDFSRRISVFDLIIPSLVPFKDTTLAQEAQYMFGVAEAIGVSTHYMGMDSPTRMRVRRARVKEVLKRSDGIDVPGRFVNGEFITRYYAAGSMLDRLKSGKVPPSQFGLDHMPKPGEQLPKPVFEVTTKFEDTDRPIAGDDILKICGISKETLRDIEEITLRVDNAIQRAVGQRGILHVDGKKEFALSADGKPVLVDTFGTADEDRWWDRAAYDANPEGAQDLSKEFVRQRYRKEIMYDGTALGMQGRPYHAALTAVRAENNARREANKRLHRKLDSGLIPEPPIPALSEAQVAQTSELYRKVAERLTGQSNSNWIAGFAAEA